MNYSHTPVLLQEVLQNLNPKIGEVFIDATLGGGGYTKALSDRVGLQGRVLAIDADMDAIYEFNTKYRANLSNGRVSNIKIIHGNFKDIAEIASNNGIKAVDGIVADLGLSSYELDSSGRGFSFQKNETLDMRFDVAQEQTALDILLKSDERHLREIFKNFGEERFSGRIAKGVVLSRGRGGVKTTYDLVEIIKIALPKQFRQKSSDTCRRIFQAIRIAVNGELSALEAFLPQAFDLLASGGRLAVVSFHSLEDRIVKQYFAKLAKKCNCPPESLVCTCGGKPKAYLISRKPIIAGLDEQRANSRSKSAKLRILEKV